MPWWAWLLLATAAWLATSVALIPLWRGFGGGGDDDGDDETPGLHRRAA
jgi:hypothetical protein